MKHNVKLLAQNRHFLLDNLPQHNLRRRRPIQYWQHHLRRFVKLSRRRFRHLQYRQCLLSSMNLHHRQLLCNLKLRDLVKRNLTKWSKLKFHYRRYLLWHLLLLIARQLPLHPHRRQIENYLREYCLHYFHKSYLPRLVEFD